ncbi:glycine cleavage system protein GcvH [Rhizobiales bacterium L72]|uniref:Glycine cleavage system H protein n=1 Tax=Propylenella binzhouense TaxID=2555902 RepID=A0A964T4X1_9HYPH|nr:glycine cleavage system protein GcvH [Propylenella binzhouense]
MRYTKDHEWVNAEGDVATIGITAYAADQLGDVVYVELPEVGQKVAKGDATATVESVKAASDVYAPVSGEVVEVNSELGDTPQRVNEAPESAGWFMKLRLSKPAELDALMDDETYRDFTDSL